MVTNTKRAFSKYDYYSISKNVNLFAVLIVLIKAIAQISLTSVRKTYKYGGRRNVPSQIELDALIVLH